jgi:hypothetical protein
MLARLKDDIERWRAVAAKANVTRPAITIVYRLYGER